MTELLARFRSRRLAEVRSWFARSCRRRKRPRVLKSSSRCSEQRRPHDDSARKAQGSPARRTVESWSTVKADFKPTGARPSARLAMSPVRRVFHPQDWLMISCDVPSIPRQKRPCQSATKTVRSLMKIQEGRRNRPLSSAPKGLLRIESPCPPRKPASIEPPSAVEARRTNHPKSGRWPAFIWPRTQCSEDGMTKGSFAQGA